MSSEFAGSLFISPFVFRETELEEHHEIDTSSPKILAEVCKFKSLVIYLGLSFVPKTFKFFKDAKSTILSIFV
jgi:hypothetical protein